jgi:uncharacterized glyoxalase superfamily protein PhnB
MLNLENLRKQAKQILRWHREGYFPVAAQIRGSLPRFAGLSDREVLEAEFRLKDAQELVARQAGFESWQALKENRSAMNETLAPSAQRATITMAEPQLFVTDIAAAIEHYQKLGMTVAFAYGEPPFYAQVCRDNARLNLRAVDRPVFEPGRREGETLLAASLVVDDVKRLFLEFQSAGVEFHQSLKKEPWGARTFIVQDPDGNLVLFAGS